MLARLYDRTLGLSRQRRVALAILLGALSALALPPWHFVALIIPAFTGLLWLLDGAAQSPRPLRAAAVTAWLFGAGHFLVGVHWIVPDMTKRLRILRVKNPRKNPERTPPTQRTGLPFKSLMEAVCLFC